MMNSIIGTDIVEIVIVSVITTVISMFLFELVARIGKLELAFPKKVGLYAFILTVSFFAVKGLFFSTTPLSQFMWILGAVILFLFSVWYGFNANPFSLRGLKHIRLYIKGYRCKPLTKDAIFNRYGGRNNFIGANDFYIPWIQIFYNKEGLKEEDFTAKIVRDENGESKRYILPLSPKVIKDVREFNRKGRVVVDWAETGRFIKLEHIKDTTKSKVVLHFEITTYFDYLASNLYVDTVVPSLRKKTIRDHLEGNVPEKALDNPRSANHGGVTALLLCSDKQLIILQNRSDNATYPNKICASTSGTLEAGDLADGSKPSPPFHALRREMEEELHLQPSDLEELYLLAIARDMKRGGSPEFIFFAKTQLISGVVYDHFSRAYEKKEESNNTTPLEIKSPQQEGFITKKIDELHFSQDLEKQGFNLPAMAAVYYYEKMAQSKKSVIF
ncbi:MAG: NUDIX hydrolase [Halobacteriota archaeon]